ncbi:hypothetical protein [Streptomyces sp. NPDC047061]|uniref:hypothetical protein n=1 Tax=Streptomyces sp. NPDC047061 TaxID=3154605 RepID=UPI003408C8F3
MSGPGGVVGASNRAAENTVVARRRRSAVSALRVDDDGADLLEHLVQPLGGSAPG